MLSATFVFSLRVDPISVKSFVVLLQFSLLKSLWFSLLRRSAKTFTFDHYPRAKS